jgi:hypothetical protein
MFSTFNKVLFGLILIAMVAYFLQSRTNTPEACKNIDGLWDATEQVCKTPTDKVIFQSLSKPHPVSIVLPENEEIVKLDKVEQVEQTIYFRGHYETKDAQGTVYLDMSQFELLSADTKGFTYFAAPFVVYTENNDSFTYVGLFSFNFSLKEAKHLRSEFLGEHIRETEIALLQSSVVEQKVFVQEGLIKVHFKSHAENQNLADYPSQANEILLQLVALDPNNDENAAFRSIVRMHPSWDLDNDQVNDCLKEGICKDDLDYSQPRVN